MISFTKRIEPIPSLTSSGVLLLDSAGSSILCNYIKVQVHTAGNASIVGVNSFVQVWLSGIGGTLNVNPSGVVAPVSSIFYSGTTPTSSGVLGITQTIYVPVEFNLNYGDECSAIHIYYNAGTGGPASLGFNVTYGVRKPLVYGGVFNPGTSIGTK